MTKERSTKGSQAINWLKSLFKKEASEPYSKTNLLDMLQSARKQALLDTDALSMIEGVLQVSDLHVRDIMIPRAQIKTVRRDDPFDIVLPDVVTSAHSRIPVIGDDKGVVVGILLGKDLLGYCGDNADNFNIRDIIRSAVFVPESKRLNVLLQEFRASRNHMAIVVDEFGAACGLVTIEDVLEQIVGEIEDEHDFAEGVGIYKVGDDGYTAKAHLPIDDFNSYFGTDFPEQEFNTMAGLILDEFGRVPETGESIDIRGFRFHIVRADSRRLRLLRIERLDEKASKEGT
jgi:magnesium and cobalt transporter